MSSSLDMDRVGYGQGSIWMARRLDVRGEVRVGKK